MNRIEWLIIAAVVVLIALALFISRAPAADCLPSATAVRKASPGAWPSWSGRESGHKGEHCWFAGDKHEGRNRHPRRLSGEGDRHRSGSDVHSGAVDLLIPLPRPRLGYRAITVEESETAARRIGSVFEIIHDVVIESAPRGNRFNETFGAATGMRR